MDWMERVANTTHAEMREDAGRRIDCPTCGAEAGHRCRDRGRFVRQPHPERLRAWLDQVQDREN